MSISCDKIFLLVSRYLSLWPRPSSELAIIGGICVSVCFVQVLFSISWKNKTYIYTVIQLYLLCAMNKFTRFAMMAMSFLKMFARSAVFFTIWLQSFWILGKKITWYEINIMACSISYNLKTFRLPYYCQRHSKTILASIRGYT